MNNKMQVRLSGIAYESLVNGPGVRRVLFAQGCTHNCKNCFNPDTHSFHGGELMDFDKIIKDIVENPILKGVTFSGGDPWEQADKFAYIAEQLKKDIMKPDFNVWCYTGYTYEYILKNKDKRNGWKELLNSIDVLVDGRFEDDKKEQGLRFRGSSNQRIIDVKESLKTNEIVILKY
ncbi:UNVERIFIED_ORG: anaerobic ribonucleoside-triphosphate reductase activating protein [Clostridium botulinum]|uniref:anaerobic ribonucleoside-triphosphate reductase activating protein n=1 Tax=Clostridium botulinum TaxID=1491 RepID=UPI0007748B4A|nr:anaerobic ribonucleoside-triphosphate reductase activating protein [Clostridium botulinum]MBN1037215.1 anaerobic ribonucleoside-triphosphate reductase activating protein [Clostridium botulinum]NFF80913.1 anaerobic ribonucleoside-triphosphate reductase activating protein [Clostridium botulinum]NFL86806.1 anaerobic ribonucleoside-triphosphate reductase activating protein [Clostridium botulinum]NFO21832.1 anaerobic ribonucleoside-triphosphate reductase activating protein [Clostridium botulinum]